MRSFQEVFLIILSLFANLKLMSAFYSWKGFSLQIGDIKHIIKHIMIMIIAIIFIFLSFFCDIWSTVENYFRKSSGPPEIIHSPFFTHYPPSKIASCPLFVNIEKFLDPAPHCRKGGGGHCDFSINKMFFTRVDFFQEITKSCSSVKYITGFVESLENLENGFLKKFRENLDKSGNLKVELLPSKKQFIICFNDSPSKMMKNAFLFKSSFCSQDI